MDPNSGNQLVRILTNQPGHLVAELASPTTSNVGPAILAVIALGVAVYVVRARSWRGLVLTVVLLLIALFSLNNGGDVYQMEMTQSEGKIAYSHAYKGQIDQLHSVNLIDISSAEMEYNHGSTRVALILRDGTQVLPLGETHVQDAPNHYVILTAIGQNPAR